MLPSSFLGEGMQIGTQKLEEVSDSGPPNQLWQATVVFQESVTVVVQDPYDALTSSTLRDEGHNNDPQYLIGDQVDHSRKGMQPMPE